MKRVFITISLLAALLMMSGCLGYQLGGSTPEGIRTVSVAPVINKTGESAVELQVSQALRSRIQFDGRLKLVNSDADAIIELTLDNYYLSAIAFRSGSADEIKTTAREYRIRLSASAQLKNAKTGDMISEAKNYGETTFEFESDLTSAKRAAARQVADDLAKYLIDDLIEQW